MLGKRMRKAPPPALRWYGALRMVVITEWLQTYHIVFDVVKNQWTKYAKFNMKIKDLRVDLSFVARRFKIWGKNGICELRLD